MIGNLSKNKKQNIPSNYMPSKEVIDLTIKIKQDYSTGVEIMEKSYTEFNGETLLNRMNLDQKAFNSYSEKKSNDPDESWRFTGVRPITRNKLISIAAHITANILIPNIFAQNEEDEEDKISGEVMRSIIEWNIQNSDYDISFLGAVISALVNPAVIVDVKFSEVMQDIKVKNDAGEITIKEVIDEFFSGLNLNIVPCEELLINNIYEYDIQKQKCLIRRRYIDYSEAEGRYGKHNDFIYVKPGVRIFYSEENGMFYENRDKEHPTLIEECIYYNRREDLEVPFINGIYMGDADTKNNQMKHRRIVLSGGEVVLVPIYQFAKSGYEMIDEKRFFYFKSAAFKLGPEQILVDSMYRMVMDGTFMQIMPPIAGFGTGVIDSSVMYPGAFTSFPSDGKIEKLDVGSRIDLGYNAISKIEQSMSESSQNEVAGGSLPDPNQKAYNVAVATQNQKTQLGLFGKMISRLVVDIGYLMVDIILNHQTIANVDELLSGEMNVKYRTFLLGDQIKEGNKITKKMVFTDEFSGIEMSDSDILKESYKLKKEGKEETEIFKINPKKFSRLRFLIRIDADILINKSDLFEKVWKLEAFDRGINNPFLDQEKWTQEHLVEVFHKGNSEKFMKKPKQEFEIQTGQGNKTINSLMEKPLAVGRANL